MRVLTMRAIGVSILRRAAAALALALALAAVPAAAQVPQQSFQALPAYNLGFTQVATASLAVTTTSARVAIPAGGNFAYFCNTGTAPAWTAYGGSGVVAVASSGQSIAPNQCAVPSTAFAGQFVAAVTASGTANLVVLVGVVTQPQLGNFDTNSILTLTTQGAGTVNSSDQVNFNGQGANCFLNPTATSGSPTAAFAIQGKDTASGSYYTLVTTTAVSATPGTPIIISTFPGQSETAGSFTARSSSPLPRTWRVQVIIAGASPSVTGTVGCSVLF